MYLDQRTLLEMQLVVWGALCLGRRCWPAIVMQKVEAGLQILSSAVGNEPEGAVSLRTMTCRGVKSSTHLSP
jgi:hypothetical protein